MGREETREHVGEPAGRLRSEAALCAIAVLAAGLAVILRTFADYGVPWDDHIQAVYGKLVARYFASGFTDTACNDLSDLRYYGPLFELLASVTFPAGDYPVFALRRLLVALTGLGVVLGVIRLARRLEVPGVPALASLALVMMPQFYGHAFINSKDIPFACAFTWLQVALSGVLAERTATWRRMSVLGIAYGLVFSMRPGSLPLVLLLTGIAFAGARLAGIPSTRSRPAWKTGWQPVGKGLVAALIAWGLMISCWPWAHESPILNPMRAIGQAARFHATYPVLFEGRVTMSDSLPWYYLPKMLLITTPIPVLGLALIGLAWAAARQARDRSAAASLVLFLVEMWLVVPLALTIALHPNIYDGLRHFLFLLPAIALLAGYGAAQAIRSGSRMLPRTAIAVCAVALLLPPLLSIVRLHPYQYSYFNAFVGGVRGATGRYETEYWVTSYREAAEWINAQEGDGAVKASRTHVLVAANPLSFTSARYYLDESILASSVFRGGLLGPLPEPYDYYLATTRYDLHRNFAAAPIVKEIGREGAVFAVIRKATRGAP